MVTKAHVITWLERCAVVYEENKAYLTDLDAPIGDSDHGINMARGFTKVAEKLPTVADKDIGAILKSVGMTLISTVGGASGPLYGTFFMRAASALTDHETLTPSDIAHMLESGLAGIVQRGRAEVGDKTMVDAFTPALAALKAAVAEGKPTSDALKLCAAAAEQGVQDTIPLIARKGRASYLGERSIGHPDPGATSAHLLLKTLAEVVSSSPHNP